MGRIQDFRKGGSRYGPPKAVPCMRKSGLKGFCSPESFCNFGSWKWDFRHSEVRRRVT